MQRWFVAQVGNLPYPRLAVGRAFAFDGTSGLPIRDTADCQSALLWLRFRRAGPLAPFSGKTKSAFIRVHLRLIEWVIRLDSVFDCGCATVARCDRALSQHGASRARCVHGF